jgi:hypothetical protein
VAIVSSSKADGLLHTEDIATAEVFYSDEEEDEVELEYIWFVNETSVAGNQSQLEGLNYFILGDDVSVQVTPVDAMGNRGEPSVSPPASVANSAPSAPEIALELLNRCGSIQFLSTTSNVSTPSSESLALDQNGLTVETWWFNPPRSDSQSDTDRFLFGQRTIEVLAYQVSIEPTESDALLKLTLPGGAFLQNSDSSSLAILSEDWNHIALSYDGAFWYLFLNGEMAIGPIPGPAEGFNTTGLPFWIGVDPSQEISNLNGSIHTLRISKEARYIEDFNLQDAHNLLRPDDYTVAHWTLGPESKTGEYQDLSGNGNTLSVQGIGWNSSCNLMFAVEDLRCRVTAESGDPDGHDIEYFFQWSVDGKEHSASWVIDGLTQEVFQEETTDQENWTCTVSAHDTFGGEGEPESKEVYLDSL